MIPRKIHYCWFGHGQKPELAQRCIESWHKYLPDYEINEWNEKNFDHNYNDYVREAYENKKWAFVADVARLYALVTEGGIYMDTDVEILKSLDELLEYDAVSGFENEKQISTALMGCRKGQPLFLEFLHDYDGIHFKDPNGGFDLTTNVARITNTCLKYGFIPNGQLQTVNGFTLLPRDYLCPKDLVSKRIKLTPNSLCIHHFDGSWLSKKDKLKKKIQRIIGKDMTALIVKLKNRI